MEKWIDSAIVYDGKIVKVRVGEVALEDGAVARREVIEHNGGVSVVPFTGHSVLMVRQFRIAAGDYVLEIPAGKLESPDDDPEARARAELREETGHEAETLHYIGYFYGAVGFCTEKSHVYIGTGLRKIAGQSLDPDERIEVVEIPLAQLRDDLDKHRYVDGKTLVGCGALLRMLDKGEL